MMPLWFELCPSKLEKALFVAVTLIVWLLIKSLAIASWLGYVCIASFVLLSVFGYLTRKRLLAFRQRRYQWLLYWQPRTGQNQPPSPLKYQLTHASQYAWFVVLTWHPIEATISSQNRRTFIWRDQLDAHNWRRLTVLAKLQQKNSSMLL